MDEGDVPPSRPPKTRWRELAALALGTSLLVAWVLTDREPPNRSLDDEPYLPEGFASWCIGFVVLMVVAAVVARARPPGRIRKLEPGILLGTAVLLLVPVTIATRTFPPRGVIDLSGLFFGALGFLAVGLVFLAVARSGLMWASRLAVLSLASFAGAFSLSGMWERRIFDGTHIAVVVLVWIAIIVVVTTLTFLTPNGRWSREPQTSRSEEPPSDSSGRRPIKARDVRMSQLGSLLWILVIGLCVGSLLLWAYRTSVARGVAFAIAIAFLLLLFLLGRGPYFTMLRSAQGRRIITTTTIVLGLFSGIQLRADDFLVAVVWLSVAALVISTRWPARIRLHAPDDTTLT